MGFLMLLPAPGVSAVADVGSAGVTTFVTLNASLSTDENICLQPSLLQTDMCIMNDGPAISKTYTNAILLGGRGFLNATTAQGLTLGANFSLRPDLALSATVRTVNAFSNVKARSLVRVDMFLCSETTCDGAVDLNYVINTSLWVGPGPAEDNSDLRASDLGFRVGLVPYTYLAVGIPLQDDNITVLRQAVAISPTAPSSLQSVMRYQRVANSSSPQARFVPTQDVPGLAVLGTRVVFEAFSDFLMDQPSLGFGAFTLDGTCTFLLYPNSTWYQQYIIAALGHCDSDSASQTFVLRGLQAGNWGFYCDDATISVKNHATDCYASDIMTCGTYKYCNLFDKAAPYPLVNLNVSGWRLLLYNLSSELACNYFLGQARYQHDWSTIMLEIISAGRAYAPAGCNASGPAQVQFGSNYQYDPDGGVNPPASVYSSYFCPAAGPSGQQEALGQRTGFAGFSAALQQKWVLGGPDVTFSMLGYERANMSRLNASVGAVETWAMQLADSSAAGSASNFNFVLTVPGWFSLFGTNVAATIGAWAGYSGVEEWINALTTHRSAASRRRGGKIIAILLVGLITLLPMLLSLLTDLLANNGNRGKTVTTYSQQAFEAPGYGDYIVVAIAQVDVSAADSELPLAMGIPFLCTLLGIGAAAVLLTEHKRRQKDRLAAIAVTELAHPDSEGAPVISSDKIAMLPENTSHLPLEGLGQLRRVISSIA